MSGGERTLLDLVDGLPDDVSVTVACPPGALADAVRERGVDWIPIPGMQASLRLHPVWTTRAMIELARSRRRVRKALRTARFDVIHANSLRAGLVSAGLRGAPRVVFVRDVLPERLTARIAARVVSRGCVRVLANSRYTGDRFRQQARHDVDVQVVYSPVDAARFDPGGIDVAEARRRLGLPEDGFVAGMVGQLTPWKGHDTAVRAVASLVGRGEDVSLVVAGSPRFATPSTRFDNRSYVEDLHRLVDQSGVTDHVRFVGERTDVDVVMRALDVLLVPSWSEPFGRVIVEALTMGTRVMATAEGGPSEILENVDDGRLVPPRDVALWADALEQELARDPDGNDVREERRERAVDRFGVQRHVASVIEVWRSLLDTPAPRVLLVNHTGDFSGAEVVLLRLLRALPPDVGRAVACPPSGPLAEALQREGWEHLPIAGTGVSFRLHPVSTPRGLYDLLRSAITLRRHARRWGADVLHANSARAGLIAALSGISGRAALVVQVHDILPQGQIGRIVRRVLARRAQRVLAVSDKATHTFNAGLDMPVATTLYIPVDHERFRPDGHDREAVRRSLGVPVDAPVLGEVAQITPWKGQLVAIEALASVRREHPDAQLVLVGQVAFAGAGVRYDNAAYDRELHERVAELGLGDAVHFAGHRDDVPAVMNALDVILLPSWDEPFGTVIAEAMATGTVPMVSDDGGPAEYVEDGRSGRVLDPRDVEAWARAAIELLDDPERRAAMSRRATEVARQFGADQYARSCVETYQAARRAAT